jgi:hypothetical protein
VPEYGTSQPLQACFSNAAVRLGLLQSQGLVTKDSSQQLPARVLWDSINELDATSQPLVRGFMIRNVLRIKVSHCAVPVRGTTHLRNGGFDLRCCGFTRRRSLSSICGEHHKCKRDLSAKVVRNTDDASVRDIRVAQ